MADRDSRKSAAGNDPDLWSKMPAALRDQENVRLHFERARDPHKAAELKAMNQSEAQRRASGDGSKMVKLHRPFPELKPQNERAVKRSHFNQDWLAEVKDARMRAYEAEHALSVKDEGQKISTYRGGITR